MRASTWPRRPLAAARSDAVAFVVMLAGPGVPGGEIVLRQTSLLLRAAGASPSTTKTRTVTVTSLRIESKE